MNFRNRRTCTFFGVVGRRLHMYMLQLMCVLFNAEREV